jgi:hypothetical protein
MISKAGKTIGIACTIAAAVAVGVAPIASAKGGNGVRAAGTCSASSSSLLKVKQSNGFLQVEFEVDQNSNGVPWNVQLSRNGKIVFSGLRTTHAPSGSFSLERRIQGGASSAIRATASRNGEVCAAAIAAGKAAPVSAASATVPAPAGVKLRGNGTVDDTQPSAVPSSAPATVAAPVADNHGGAPGADDASGHHLSDG